MDEICDQAIEKEKFKRPINIKIFNFLAIKQTTPKPKAK